MSHNEVELQESAAQTGREAQKLLTGREKKKHASRDAFKDDLSHNVSPKP